MKYGETLRQRSIPAWSHHNIDYDEIKAFIKEHTTPGKGKTVPIPGQTDEKLLDFEIALFKIFKEQHDRIGMFVKSKAGEIRRRIDHARKQLDKLQSRKLPVEDNRVPIARLERYGKLENVLVKAGDEIQSLSRFTSTQRTAFRKLLKKAKKWTKSDGLTTRFNNEVLDDSKSFTKLDFQPLLDDYSDTLQGIRNLYTSNVKLASSKPTKAPEPSKDTSTLQRLRASLETRSKVEFDTAVATVALGEHGARASYFVHPDNVVELQILLLQHMQYYSSQSGHGSITRSSSDSSPNGSPRQPKSPSQDYFMRVADDPERFAKVEGAATVNEREHLVGAVPQRAKHSLRWTSDEDAILASTIDSAKVLYAPLKRKYADMFFDSASKAGQKSEVSFTDRGIGKARKELLKDKNVRSLYKISSCRTRFTGIIRESEGVLCATLDTNITMQEASTSAADDAKSMFPFAVLQARKEGADAEDIISRLDQSHLVERVRGFSLQHHTLWELCKGQNISPPFWVPILSRDIRKVPPSARGRIDSVAVGASGDQSTLIQLAAPSPNPGLTDGTTAVDTTRPSSVANADSYSQRTPPISSFRKKRRRKYPREERASPTRERYWNEYDNPEDGEGDNAYVIYIDPNERSTLDKVFDSIGNLFSPRQSQPEAAVCPPSPETPRDDETSSDDDEETALVSNRQNTYGTHNQRPSAAFRRQPTQSLPQVTLICLAASIAILTITFILAMTSKHRYVREVDTAIIFAIVCSLVFAVVGFVALMGQREQKGQSRSYFAIGIAGAVLLLDAVGSGALLAWMLG